MESIPKMKKSVECFQSKTRIKKKDETVRQEEKPDRSTTMW